MDIICPGVREAIVDWKIACYVEIKMQHRRTHRTMKRIRNNNKPMEGLVCENVVILLSEKSTMSVISTSSI